MTTDRELLELAAKVAGFGTPGTGSTCWTMSEYPRGSGQHGALWNYVGHMDTAQLWNPLTDDGDTQRLRVKMRVEITYVGNCIFARVRRTDTQPHEAAYKQYPTDDRYDDERRAIVNAVAMVARKML